jgi:Ca-activated chloride channel family protein
MRNRTIGFLLAGAAAAALLTGCASETGGGSDEIATEIAAPPPPPAPPPPQAEARAQQKLTVTGAMSAGDYAAAAPPPPMMMAPEPEFRDQYEDVDPNPVKLTSEEPVSTFSIDVDTASYANVRRFLKSGVLPPKDAVRIEEMVNYFDYTYPQPEEGADPFATYVTLAPSPFAEGRQLMQIGIRAVTLTAMPARR